MAYNTALNTVYNYYLSTYSKTRGSSQFDTHKKSELRNIYNTIVKLNRESPLSIFDTTKDTKAFAVGIKENALELSNTIASLGGMDENTLLNKKIAYSSNENFVSAEYIGNCDDNTEIPSFTLEVQSLAAPQVNVGTYLPDEVTSLPADTYSFDLNINDLSYEFQFSVHEGESNTALQNRLARLINSSDIGIKAVILSDEEGNSALRITSVSTGLPEGKNCLFSISDSHTSKKAGAVAYLGINYMARNASNASFILNGEQKSACSNNFTIEKTYEVTLNGIRSVAGEAATIGVKTDTESLTDNVTALVNAYNSFMDDAAAYLDRQPKSSRLVSEMAGVVSLYKNDLDAVGLTLRKDGHIAIDKDALCQSALEDNAKETFHSVREFANALVRKSKQITIDPMHYASSKIVAYKNPGKNFSQAYITSAYSGMLFNSYC